MDYNYRNVVRDNHACVVEFLEQHKGRSGLVLGMYDGVRLGKADDGLSVTLCQYVRFINSYEIIAKGYDIFC